MNRTDKIENRTITIYDDSCSGEHPVRKPEAIRILKIVTPDKTLEYKLTRTPNTKYMLN